MIQNNPKRGKWETQSSLNSITFATTRAAAALPICQQHLQPPSRQRKVINFSLLINSPLNAVLQPMRFSDTQSRGYHLFLERYSQTSSLVLSWPTLEDISKIAYFSHNNWVSRQKNNAVLPLFYSGAGTVKMCLLIGKCKLIFCSRGRKLSVKAEE